MRKQHINFRAEEVNFVTGRWNAVEPVSLIGVGSVGKSNLLHHLADPDVHKKYMEEHATNFKSIILDPYLLGPLPVDSPNISQHTVWAGLELIMHRLYMAFYSSDMLPDEDKQRFFDLYQTLQNGSNPLFAYMGVRYLELGLRVLFDNDIRLVLMFDEFEEFLRLMPYKFFQTLRGLRDTYKSRLTFLIFTRSSLPVLLDEYDIDYLAIEPFIELFNDNVQYVGPYNEQDAMFMLHSLIRRNPRMVYHDYYDQFLLNVSGRFAGILRASFRALDYLGTIHPNDINNEAIIQKMASRSSVKAECRTIWMSLSDIEQEVLKAVAQLADYHNSEAFEEGIKMLLQKRLLTIHRNTQTLAIEPPVFKFFVQSDP